MRQVIKFTIYVIYNECIKLFVLSKLILVHTCEKYYNGNQCGMKLCSHFMIHTCKKPSNCYQCGMCLCNNSRIHTIDKHSNCYQCGRNLCSHLRIHTNDKPSNCCQCYRSFCNHLKIHTSEKPSKCYQCGMSLYCHLRIHTNDKPSNRYQSDRSFRNHLQIHTSEKPSKCYQCGMSLCCHFRIHTSERPSNCYQCGMCLCSHLPAHTNLCNHLRIHTSEKPSNYCMCGMSLRSYSRIYSIYTFLYICGNQSHNSFIFQHFTSHTIIYPLVCFGSEKIVRNDLFISIKLLCCVQNYVIRSNRIGLLYSVNLTPVRWPLPVTDIIINENIKCHIMNVSFPHLSSYLKIMWTHTRDKPSQCSDCDFYFLSKLSLLVIMRVYKVCMQLFLYCLLIVFSASLLCFRFNKNATPLYFCHRRGG